MSNLKRIITFLLLFLGISTVYLLIGKEFRTWPQIDFYFTENESNLTNISNCQFYGCRVDDFFFIHRIRYEIVNLVFKLSRWLNAPFKVLFHIQLCLLLSLSIFLQTLLKEERKVLLRMLPFAIVNMALAYLMNGRMVYVLLATSISLYLLIKKEQLSWWLFITLLNLSSILANVSTGTTAIFFMYAVILVFLRIRLKIHLFEKALLTISLVPWGIYTLIGFFKNFVFFHGKVSEFLKHGLGIPMIVVSGSFIIYMAIKIARTKKVATYFQDYNIITIFILISVAVSAIGISSITPALSLVCYTIAEKGLLLIQNKTKY